MEANPFYLKDSDGGYYNKYPEFQIWEDGRKEGFIEGQSDKGHNEAILRTVTEAKKEGMREVVEFVKSQVYIDNDMLDNFLKEREDGYQRTEREDSQTHLHIKS